MTVILDASAYQSFIYQTLLVSDYTVIQCHKVVRNV